VVKIWHPGARGDTVNSMLRDAFELLGAALLVGTAFYAFRGRARDVSRFSLVAGVGTLGLAIDEFFNLHERLGRAAYEDWNWPRPPIVNHHDDAFLVVIALAGVATIAWYQQEIRRHRPFAMLFLAGLALFAAAVVWDSRADPTLTASWWTEEALEFAGAATMLGAFRVRLYGTPEAGLERAMLLAAPAETEP
jgi:hypothetical protein